MEAFVRWQTDLDKVSNFKDLISAVEILRVNQLEHRDKLVYGNLTVYQLARTVFDGLLL